MENLRRFDLENDYLNNKETLEYPTVSFTNDNEKVWVKDNPIGTFTVGWLGNDAKYNFRKGMTWEEFIDSEYNSNNHFSKGNTIVEYYRGNTFWNCNECIVENENGVREMLPLLTSYVCEGTYYAETIG